MSYDSPPPPPPPPPPPSGGYGPPSTGGYGPAPTSSKATLSLVFGILGLVVCTPLAVAALVIGNQAKQEIAASGGTLGGEGLAKAGVILGWIGVAFLVAIVVFFFVALAGGVMSSQN